MKVKVNIRNRNIVDSKKSQAVNKAQDIKANLIIEPKEEKKNKIKAKTKEVKEDSVGDK